MKKTKMWMRIVRCNDIPLREGRAVRVGSREIAIFHLGDRFLAVDNRCPHRGGPLADGIVSGNAVICPLHAWKVSLESGEGLNSASASSCVQTYRTRVEEGIVFLELNEDSRVTQKQSGEDLPAICLEAGALAALNDLPLGSSGSESR